MIPESGRQAAHVLLDAVSAYDAQDPDRWPAAMSALAGRLIEVGAVVAEFDDESDTVDLEMGPVVAASSIVITRLIRELQHHTGKDQSSLVVWLREEVDSL